MDNEDLLRELEQRGVPDGTWLLDIARIRQELEDADQLLRRLQQAIIDAAGARADRGGS
jgi:hypothetical protein